MLTESVTTQGKSIIVNNIELSAKVVNMTAMDERITVERKEIKRISRFLFSKLFCMLIVNCLMPKLKNRILF
jgi:hypothetical protein